jgi:hypothetical protein
LGRNFWLSVAIPGFAALCLIAAGAVKRRYLVLAIGILGLLASLGWLILGLYVEAVIE